MGLTLLQKLFLFSVKSIHAEGFNSCFLFHGKKAEVRALLPRQGAGTIERRERIGTILRNSATLLMLKFLT